MGIAKMGFWLLVILIVVVYAKGATAEGKVLFDGFGSLAKIFSGRKEDGTFADYPGGYQ